MLVTIARKHYFTQKGSKDHMGKNNIQENIRKKMENKVGAVFTTSENVTGGKETTIFSIIQAFMIYGMVIVGDPMAATGHYGVSCVGKPDKKTMEQGRLLGKRVAELALKVAK